MKKGPSLEQKGPFYTRAIPSSKCGWFWGHGSSTKAPRAYGKLQPLREMGMAVGLVVGMVINMAVGMLLGMVIGMVT